MIKRQRFSKNECAAFLSKAAKVPSIKPLCVCFNLQFVSRVDIKYKRMNSNERVRIVNSGSTTLPRQGFETLRPEGENRSDTGGTKLHMSNQEKLQERAKISQKKSMWAQC